MLQVGNVIKTIDNETIEVVKFLAKGGQGEVYLVKFRGQQKALKWYTCSFIDEKAFYENLKANVDRGTPAPQFLWPQAVTVRTMGSFGYIMDLIPDGYYEVDKFMIARDVRFSSFKAATEACLQITSAFRILHLHGYTYQDLSGGNFVIDPIKGNVLICDNDNVAPNGVHTGVLGTPGWMAPEVVARQALPSVNSDKFSMAILLFVLLCANHPLEGARWAKVVCMTREDELRLYGTQPVFICDPEDSSNAPVPGVHDNVCARWGYLPSYMKETFVKAFCQKAIREPNRRLSEFEWLQALCRFRSSIVSCSNPNCNGEIFISDAKTTICDCCGKAYIAANKLKLPMYEMPIVKGARVYRCQLGTCKLEDALSPIASVVARGDELGIRNKSGRIWSATTPSGKSKKVEPEEVIPVRTGISFKMDDNVIEIQ